MSDRLWRVPFEAEMTLRNGKVGCDRQIFARACPQQRAIIADTKPQGTGSGSTGALADAADQVELFYAGRGFDYYSAFAITARPAGGTKLGTSVCHLLRIGHQSESVRQYTANTS